MSNIVRPFPFQVKISPKFPFSKATSVVCVCLTIHSFPLHKYLCIFLLSLFQRKSHFSYETLMHICPWGPISNNKL